MKFGDFCAIEQKRFNTDNEFYSHKIIGTLRSNSYVDVPVGCYMKETLHNEIVDVVACITCGVCEREVFRYRQCDVRM